MFAREEFSNEGTDSNHFFQLYGTDSRRLEKNVGEYLWESLKRGGAAVVVAVPEHEAAFKAELVRLGADLEQVEREGRLLAFDAGDLLGRILIDGYPDAARFDHWVGGALREAVATSAEKPVHAYGEMVGILWKTNQFPAAIRLEQLWNRLRRSLAFELFCAYPIDVFDKQFDSSVVGALLGAHTHLLPSGPNEQLDSAIQRAMNEQLNPSAPRMQQPAVSRAGRPVLPPGEAAILWLRRNHPKEAEAVLAQAKQYYEAACG